MSTDHDSSFGGWDDSLDRRDLLVRAGGVGALLAIGGMAGASRALAKPSANVGKVTAFFGQFGAIAEQEGIRKYVFKGFNGDVDPIFVPITAPTQFVDRVRAEAKAGKGNLDLLIGLHGDFVTFQNEGLIRGVDDVAKKITTLPPALMKIGKLVTKTQYYIPQSQATYVMVANKSVLKYMPKGADINALHIWAGLRLGQGDPEGHWARTGSGFLPAAPGSSTASSRASSCRRSRAASSRTSARRTRCTHGTTCASCGSTRIHSRSRTGSCRTHSSSEEVLLAWDHVARLKTALDQRSDLVAFPVPAGPKGARVHARHRRNGDPEERAQSRRRGRR